MHCICNDADISSLRTVGKLHGPSCAACCNVDAGSDIYGGEFDINRVIHIHSALVSCCTIIMEESEDSVEAKGTEGSF